jgi:uncharacterized protein YceH (UPF0502 family)
VEQLSAPEGRVVASLVEKALAVPQSYPLTLHALVAACNQTSSRDPVTAYPEEEVLAALDSLRSQHLVRAVLPSHGRSVVRYRHVLDEALGLDAPQLALLAVLELRGAQTPSELRTRTERMARIDDVDHELGLLAGRAPPLAARVGRRTGERQERWVSLLTGAPGEASPATADLPADRPVPIGATGPVVAGEAVRAEVAALRAEVDDLRAALASLEAALAALRENLGG